MNGTWGPAGVLPERPYTRDELRSYLQHGRRKCRAVIEGLTEEKAREHHNFGFIEGSVVELLLDSMRHVHFFDLQITLPGFQKRKRISP